MSVTQKHNTGKVLVGNCLDRLKELADNSIDSIVTDPPYELGFMGKKWDASGIAYNVELWRECLRVLKPGLPIIRGRVKNAETEQTKQQPTLFTQPPCAGGVHPDSE